MRHASLFLLCAFLSVWRSHALPRAGKLNIFTVLDNINIYSICVGCSISINNDLSDPQPLVLRPEGGQRNDAFFLPTSGDTIPLSESQIVQVACPNGNVIVSGTSTGSVTGQATCTNGLFSIAGKNVPFSSITCSIIPYHTARFTGNTCLSNFREAEIGFLINSRFIQIMTACFDQSRQHTPYTEFPLTKTIGGYQSGFPRPGWFQGSGFFSVGSTSVDTLYTQARQRITINNLLGLPESSTQYIGSGDFYLARGHLVAKADFLYGSQQRATFYFVNAAPQWQIFNGQNWNYLEQDVRSYASRNALDLTVYTGTYGVTTLPHATTGQDVELYLFVDGANRGIPVPRLFWKILYEPISRAGIVFVGVNNPYVLNPARDVICTNVCNQVNWLSWKATNATLGYGYCCSVADFRNTVTSFPNIDVVKLLT